MRKFIRRSLTAICVVVFCATATAFGAAERGLASARRAGLDAQQASVSRPQTTAGKKRAATGKRVSRKKLCLRSKAHSRRTRKQRRRCKAKKHTPAKKVLAKPVVSPAPGGAPLQPLTAVVAPVPILSVPPAVDPEEKWPIAEPPPKPTNTVRPAIDGTPEEGNTLTATSGVWEGEPSEFSYQWEDCLSTHAGTSCSVIADANTPSYTLGSQDIGLKALVVVEATNTAGNTTANSEASRRVVPETTEPPPAEAPTNKSLPTISGSTTEGQTLTATVGAWTGSPTSYGYEWEDCDTSGMNCSAIAGAIAASYTLRASDVGHTIRATVTATNIAGPTIARSTATATVVEASTPPPPPPPPPPPSPPANTVLPSISGSPVEGQSLTVVTGTWSGSPSSYSYLWQDCDASGSSCTNTATVTPTYHLTSSDVGHTVRALITATNSGGSTTAASAVTAVVASGAMNPNCTTTINSGLQAAIQNAASGSTICLNAGNYGSLTLTTNKSSMVTVQPAPGVIQSQAVLGYTDLTTSSNLTFEGLTIAGGNNGSSSAPATHIRWIGDAFTSGLCIQTPTSANIDLLVETSTFVNIGTGGCSNEGRLEVNGDNEGVSGVNGVVLAHDLFQTGSPSGCTDGVNITGGASGTQIGPGDEFSGLKQGSCTAHVDSIQFYGASDTTVTGDYFHGNSDGIMSPDGNGSPMTVTNTVFDTDGEYPDQIVIGGGEHDVISHDTFGHGARLRIGHVNVGATASNETITNNVLTGGLELSEGQSSSGWVVEYNLVEGEMLGVHSIEGKPIYSGGGSEPATWAGWMLASGSPGDLAAGDGGDMGTNYFGS